ncbi:capping protein-inhibiting regulator of actin dynamics isoform X2 [Betta splendens]|uniref:Capping protein-inhibiting regulator of actin dynamics isoform X2 n=1 Tax=Betta splendens TaxID=158456 RepID=A0A6P7NWF9_BETSP|nr:capping protein-inhibiting regulator of actin dynamics isoform X2 [Betta splendens]
MSWFQALRDDFTLRPFELEQTRSSQPASSTSLGSTSDRAAMASGPADVLANQEPAEVQEDCSGKKKSRFQTFKKFFARKKRKEPSGAGADDGLKGSQSSDNVSKASENNTLTPSDKDKGSGSKSSLGTKALSHDSVFVSDSSEANEALGASQDSIHGKVKSLQLQLKQAIKMGSPPSLMCMKGREDPGTMSEDDGLPCSPPEYTTLHAAMNQAQRNSSTSLERDDDQLSCAASSRAVSPLVVPGDFSQPASPFGCLDNSAAKHKMGLRHKACNRRKPASRLELKAEEDSVDEVLNASVTEVSVEHEQLKTEDVSFDELKLNVERGEDEDEEGEEVEKEPQQRSTLSLSTDREERADESEAGQDVSHHSERAASPQPSLSVEDVSDSPPLPSPKPCSSASSVDSLRASPEPPAGRREYLLDPAGVACGAEESRDDSELAFREEDDRGAEEEEEEEESSFLQEVLSSLKTPLPSCLLNTEADGGVLEMEREVKEEDKEEFEIEEGEEMKEEGAELEETDIHQSSPSDPELSSQTSEEEEDAATVSCEDEVIPEEELEEEQSEEEEVLLEEINQHRLQEEVEEVKSQQKNNEDERVRQTHVHVEGEADDEDYQSGGEEEAIELEKEAEVEEEGREKTEEPDEERREGKERVEEAEEATEEERDDAEEMTERFPHVSQDDAQVAVTRRKTDYVVGDDAARTTKPTGDGEIPADVCDGGSTAGGDQNHGGQDENGEEKEVEHSKRESEPEEETNQEAADQDSEEVSHGKEAGNGHSEAEEQAPAASLPPPESGLAADSPERQPIAPSKTSTIHINLVSPGSDTSAAFFQRSPTSARPKDGEEPPFTAAAGRDAEEVGAATPAGVEQMEAEAPAGVEEETKGSVEEALNHTSPSSDQTRVRFTVAAAWQRTQGSTPPSSPTATEPEPHGLEAAAGRVEPAGGAEAEPVLSPVEARNAGSGSGSAPAAAGTDTGSSVSARANPDNPFGVRLRKTSAPRRFSSEEETAETPAEATSQPRGCGAEPPAGARPLLSQPVSTRPAVPKKPDVHRDAAKTKSPSDPAAGGGLDSPSWISVAKQKQKIYKDSSLEEISLKKEEPERKSSLPTYIASAAVREQSNNPADSGSTVSLLETSQPPAPAEKEARKAATKSPPPPSPVAPKPQFLPPPQPHSAPRSLSPPTPVPVYQKPPCGTSPSPPAFKPAQPQLPAAPPPPAASRSSLESAASRPPGLPGPGPSAQRGLPGPASPPDEPPWMALAKKKAKAWSEMPQIVQ